MIRIQKIRLRNFKSFRKAEIPVSNGFTAIVGSNGSGKSNILDAFLFVFGINSLKALRASRMTDLVNNQAKDDYAKVEIEVLDDASQKPYIISRSIDTHGKSVMRLNDKRVTLNEVQGLLEEIGIKPFGHNIVVQGDITQIIEMNAIQRREMIDEVAGIREFDEKKAEAHKELERVDARIKEVRIVLSERVTQLEQLAKDREAAMRHRELQEELKKSKATLLKFEIDRFSEDLEKNSGKKQKLIEEKTKKESRMAELRSELLGIERELEETRNALMSASQKTFSEFGILAEEKKSEKRVREERIRAQESSVEKQKIRLESITNRESEIAKELLEKNKSLAEKNAEVAALEKALSVKQLEMAKAKKGFDSAKQELASLQRELDGIESESENATRSFFEHESELETLKRTDAFKRKELSELRSESKAVMDRLEALQERKKALSALSARYSDPKALLSEISQKIEETVRSHSYAQSALEVVQSSMRALQKSAANCPTCDSDLSEKQKDRVLTAKRAEEKRLSLAAGEAREKRAKWLDEKREMETILEKHTQLSQEIVPLQELLNKKQRLDEKISHLRSELDEKKRTELETVVAALKQQMEVASQSVEEKRGEIDSFSKQSGFEALHAISEEINALSSKLGSLLGIRKELQLSTEMVLSDELGGLKNERHRIENEIRDIHALVLHEKADIKALETELEKLNLEIRKSEQGMTDLDAKKTKLDEKLFQSRERMEKDALGIRDAERRMSELEVERGKSEVKLLDLKEEFVPFEGSQTLESFEAPKLRSRLPEIEHEIARLGAINQKALENFSEYEREMLEIKKKNDRLEEERLAVLDMIQKIEDRRTRVFMDCFEQVNSNFREMHFLLGEGSGKLELENLEKPLESGLLIEASLKGKEIHNIDAMSGGEKTLTALAFLFAIQLYDNAPFYIFDEADAALDKENSAKLARIIAKISQKNQFIGITHNDTIVKQANQIIGVALNEQKSSVIGLKLRATEESASQVVS